MEGKYNKKNLLKVLNSQWVVISFILMFVSASYSKDGNDFNPNVLQHNQHYIKKQ